MPDPVKIHPSFEYEWATSWPGVLSVHMNSCPARDGGACICGPLGYRASAHDPATGERIVSPLLETEAAAATWRAEHLPGADGAGQEPVLDGPADFATSTARGPARRADPPPIEGPGDFATSDGRATVASRDGPAEVDRRDDLATGEGARYEDPVPPDARRDPDPPPPDPPRESEPPSDPAPPPDRPLDPDPLDRRRELVPQEPPQVYASGDRLEDFVEEFLDAAGDGRARDPRGRRYAPGAVEELGSALHGHVAQELGSFDLRSVRRWQVQALVNELSDSGLSPRRLRAIVAGMRGLYGYAIEEGLVDSNPADRVLVPVEEDDDDKPATGEPEPFTTTEHISTVDAAGREPVIPERVIWQMLKIVSLGFVLIALVLAAESV